jgi:hypothetical protein
MSPPGSEIKKLLEFLRAVGLGKVGAESWKDRLPQEWRSQITNREPQRVKVCSSQAIAG